MVNMNDRLVAYVGTPNKDGMGCDRSFGHTNDLITWDGAKIGTCTLGKGWPIRSYLGSRMYQIYAWHGGIQWTGRGMGEGMSVFLRPTKGQNL